jgi:hypothetical protein
MMKPVAAAQRRNRDRADANCIEQTTCEGRVLLLTTEAMDFWLRVDRDSVTRAVYWPAALLLVIIGPHVYNVDIGARLAHGTDILLSPWASEACEVNWSKYPVDFPFQAKRTSACFPPLMLLTLEGITKVLIFTKVGGGLQRDQCWKNVRVIFLLSPAA